MNSIKWTLSINEQQSKNQPVSLVQLPDEVPCLLMFSYLPKLHIEGWAQDYSNSNIFLKPLFRGKFDPFVNNANLGAIAHTSNGT